MAEILLGNIKGKDGRGLDIKGVAENIASLPTSAEVGDIWVIPVFVEGEPNDWNISEAYLTGEMYIWNGSEWMDIGSVKGEKGDKGDVGDTGYITVNGIKPDEDGDITLTADKVGAVSKTIVLDGEDILSISEDGWYYTRNCTNTPISGNGYMRVIKYNDAYRTVEWTSNGSRLNYLNILKNGNWIGWCEMLHTGNKGARIESQSYTGNGLYGFENARTFTFTFQPIMFYISGYGRGGGNYTLTVPYGFPFAHTVVHTSDGGYATMNCEFRYSGNTITVYNTTSANNGFNTDGKDYTIIAIG